MFDYKLIEALVAVAEKGGFDRAAKCLHITQSAVSQRLKALENQMGQILLVRANPPHLTPSGQDLLKHYRQVKHLEDELLQDTAAQIENEYTPMAIAINADSLATWFLSTIQAYILEEKILLDLHVEDQEQTQNLLKNGEVIGCISTQKTAIQGCNHKYIGCMDYHMVAAPDFAKKWFPEGLSQANTKKAPAIIFNRKDDLHYMFLEQNFGMQQRNIPAHYIPSSERFPECMVEGLGYGLLPYQQSRPHIQKGQLIDLSPGHTLQVKLYWHCWNLKSERLNKLSDLLSF